MRLRRLDFIDFTRGIAALVVLISHAGFEVGYFDKLGVGYSWINLGQIGVISFFLVSGFVIPLSLDQAQSIPSFIIRRIFRLYPLFLVLIIATIALQSIGIFYPSKIAGNYIPVIFLNLAFLVDYTGYPNIVPNSWTLSVEVIWYVFFGALFYLKIYKRPILLALLVTALFSVTALGSMYLKQRLPLGRLGMLGACLLGYYFYLSFYNKIAKKTFMISVTLLLISIFFLLYTAFFHFQSEKTTFGCVLISWITGLLIFYFPLRNYKSAIFQNTIFKKIGLYSYSIYLIHPLVIYGCMHLFSGSFARLTAMLFFSLALSALTYRLIEKPSITLGKKIDALLASKTAVSVAASNLSDAI